MNKGVREDTVGQTEPTNYTYIAFSVEFSENPNKC